jgi:stearoyl-CoA desaturase (delta-9 desaturase)
LILLHLGCGCRFVTGVSGPALAVFLLSSGIQLFGITAGYHRLLAHRSFKTSRQFQFVLALCGVLAGQNGPLWWVGHHRHHHRYADRAQDLHSPVRGFFWSHMGWLFSPYCVRVRRRLVGDLARSPELVVLERYSYALNLAYALLLYIGGDVWRAVDASSDTSGFQFVVWGAVISTVCVYHAVWSANSFCHRYGSRRYLTGDDSRNNFLVSLVTFGDGWHHNHHHFPYSARHGFRWWEIDINFAILKLLSLLGIVWDLRMPPQQRSASHSARASPG